MEDQLINLKHKRDEKIKQLIKQSESLNKEEKEIEELTKSLEGKKQTFERNKQAIEKNKKDLEKYNERITNLKREFFFDLMSYKGIYKETRQIGSVTNKCIIHTFKKNFTLRLPTEEYHYKGDHIKGIEFIDCWKDGTNGTLDLNPINGNEFRIKCTSQPFRGYHWDIKIYC